MEQNPSLEASSHSASQGILCIFMEPEGSLPCLQEPATPSHCFLKTHSNIILPFIPRTSEWSLPFRFSDQNVVCISHLSHACYMLSLSHPPEVLRK